jgi:hypothetical protein
MLEAAAAASAAQLPVVADQSSFLAKFLNLLMPYSAVFLLWVAQLFISGNSLQDKQHNQVVNTARPRAVRRQLPGVWKSCLLTVPSGGSLL